jgi:hypothetical protein
MNFFNKSMQYLLVATTLFLSPLLNPFVPVAAAPAKCSQVLAQSKAALTDVQAFKTIKYNQYDGIPPKGRTQHLAIVMGERSSELAMTKRIIASCPKIGSVSFIMNGTDDQNRYGLLNGKVQAFKCQTAGDTDTTIKWGQYGCS